MEFIANINVMPLKELLDPQGKAVMSGFKNLELDGVVDARVGKRVQLTLKASSEENASAKVKEACEKLLANHVVESFDFEIVEK